ncbi:LysM peptidoglycan-binding domain-containing protein [Hyphomonas johnsonii]|uniref:LysM peptidoglycan-binding domain-containing protein n=1 Tax=Hyphomonas johnsonii TaxID=81031 RepID=UPI00138DE397|nr:LysM domain-containing protein [Hyphomonas johnsonii]
MDIAPLNLPYACSTRGVDSPPTGIVATVEATHELIGENWRLQLVMLEEENEPETEPSVGWIAKLVLRCVAISIALGSYIWLSAASLSKIADWTAILFTWGGLYLAVFEPKALGWIISRVAAFVRQWDKGTAQWPNFWVSVKNSWSGLNWRRLRRRKPAARKRTGPKTRVAPAPIVPSNVQRGNGSTPLVGDESIRLAIVAAALVALVAILLLTPTPEQAAESTPGVPPSDVVEIVETPDEAISGILDAPASIQPQVETDRHKLIRTGDTCWTIAERCTGNAERFVELGPPVNDWLDVSNREFCPINPGEVLNIPDDWPTDCLLDQALTQIP